VCCTPGCARSNLVTRHLPAHHRRSPHAQQAAEEVAPAPVSLSPVHATDIRGHSRLLVLFRLGAAKRMGQNPEQLLERCSLPC
jgi:hypothetical protein